MTMSCFHYTIPMYDMDEEEEKGEERKYKK
jgi:hypothetical protein